MPHAVRDVALILLAGAVTMLPRLDAGDLHLDGVLYAEVARGLAERGAWLDLTIGGDPYWRKPPLVFWLMRGAYWIGGVSEATARAPSLLAGILCGVALYFLVARLWDARVGLLAGVVLATTSPFVQNAVTARLDTVPTLLSLLSLLAFVRAADSRRPLDFVLAGACCGLAVMAKGVFGLTGPFFFVLYCATTGRLRTLATRGFLVAMLAGAVIALPWHVYQVARWGSAFLDVYLFEQVVDRATGGLGGYQQSRSYFASLLRDDWPWLPFTLGGLVMAALAARRGDRRAAFLLAWAFGYLGLVSLSAGQRARYLVQLYPPASIMAALALDRLVPARWRVRVPAAIGGLCAAGLLVVALLPRGRSDDAAAVRSLGPALERLAPGARVVEAYRIPDLPLRATFLFYLGRDLRNVRQLPDARDGLIVAYVTRREELAAAGLVPAFANARFVLMTRGG
jgi:4-amino-4-deoxy-L-arabinose transferase-like glycosyltransferase